MKRFGLSVLGGAALLMPGLTARVMGDRHARNAKLREAEAEMIGDAPVIPLYVYTQKHLVKPYVRGWQSNLLDRNLSRYMFVLEHQGH